MNRPRERKNCQNIWNYIFAKLSLAGFGNLQENLITLDKWRKYHAFLFNFSAGNNCLIFKISCQYNLEGKTWILF